MTGMRTTSFSSTAEGGVAQAAGEAGEAGGGGCGTKYLVASLNILGELENPVEFLPLHDAAFMADYDVMQVRGGGRSIPPPWWFNSVSSGTPHVRPMGKHRTRGEPEPDTIKKNTHPEYVTWVLRRERGLLQAHGL